MGGGGGEDSGTFITTSALRLKILFLSFRLDFVLRFFRFLETGVVSLAGKGGGECISSASDREEPSPGTTPSANLTAFVLFSFLLYKINKSD